MQADLKNLLVRYVRQVIVDVKPIDPRTAVIVETGWKLSRIVEDSYCDIDAFGSRFVSKANTASASRTVASPAAITGIITGWIA